MARLPTVSTLLYDGFDIFSKDWVPLAIITGLFAVIAKFLEMGAAMPEFSIISSLLLFLVLIVFVSDIILCINTLLKKCVIIGILINNFDIFFNFCIYIKCI